MLRTRSAAALLACLALATACADTDPAERDPSSASPTADHSSPSEPEPTPDPSEPTSGGSSTGAESGTASGLVPPWLGTRPLTPRADGTVAPQPTPEELDPRAFTLPDRVSALAGDGFASETEAPAPASVIARSTWHAGCPVAAHDLAWIRVTFWGFDDARHTGELLVASSVADDLVRVFARLYDARFPLEEMRVTSAAALEAAATGDGNNSESFVCRPTTGGTAFSQHAYGTAVDINPFQNPYDKGSGDARVVIPELATSYTDRSAVRPGMVLPGDPVVEAFAAIGWQWGGQWRSLKDYQHFSLNGR